MSQASSRKSTKFVTKVSEHDDGVPEDLEGNQETTQEVFLSVKDTNDVPQPESSAVESVAAKDDDSDEMGVPEESDL